MATEGINTRVFIAMGIVALFSVITFALAAATLGTLNKRYNALQEQIANIDSKLTTTPVTTVEGNTTTTSTIAPTGMGSTPAPTTTGSTPAPTTTGSTPAPTTTGSTPAPSPSS